MADKKVEVMSKWTNVSTKSKAHMEDPNYGRPPPGSKTEARGVKAFKQINNEIDYMCDIIRKCGIETGNGDYVITFGELFQIYTKISNKIVGLLLRGRKHGLVDFEGEMLFQRRDDDKIIRLFKEPKDSHPS